MTENVKVAVIGTGGMGRLHSDGFSKNSRCDLLGIAGRNKTMINRMQQGDWQTVDYGDELASFKNPAPIPQAYYSFEELAKDKSIDAVSICLPNKYHAPVAIMMLESGKHVLVEKPMAGTVQECNQMIETAKKNNLVLQIGHMWRFHSDMEMIRQVIASGMIGEIVKIKGYGIHVNWGPDGWFVDKDLAMGGALIDMGVHAIDTISYCLGDVPPVRVNAVVDSRYGNYEVDDNGIIMVKYANGATGIIESGWKNPFADGGEASTQFFGTKGYARINPTQVHYELAGKWGIFEPERKPGETTFDEEALQTYYRQIDAFIDAIHGDSPCSVPGEVGKQVIQVVEAAYRSAKEGVEVAVNA